MCDQQSLKSACAYAQPDQSLCVSLAYSMNVKPLTDHHFVFLSLKGDCTGSSESTLDKMLHCWKSHVTAQRLWKSQVLLHQFEGLCYGNVKKNHSTLPRVEFHMKIQSGNRDSNVLRYCSLNVSK